MGACASACVFVCVFVNVRARKLAMMLERKEFTGHTSIYKHNTLPLVITFK